LSFVPRLPLADWEDDGPFAFFPVDVVEGADKNEGIGSWSGAGLFSNAAPAQRVACVLVLLLVLGLLGEEPADWLV